MYRNMSDNKLFSLVSCFTINSYQIGRTFFLFWCLLQKYFKRHFIIMNHCALKGADARLQYNESSEEPMMGASDGKLLMATKHAS